MTTIFDTSVYDLKIAGFMQLTKDKKWWSHPTQSAVISDSLGFSYEWDWLMPVVEKIQRNYRVHVSLKECENNGWGITTQINIFGLKQYNYYWADYQTIKDEIADNVARAARYGEKYEDDNHVIVDSKFQAIYCAVCRFVEWWETQDRKIVI